ncbi:hypothetical protein BX285_2486 [Streptomyces sp. 1114.5]|uniref:hypothetical protein n=1 Tax=unclassified Streptomyces TaxID=2593676 RepID=UPI000BD1DAEB|nr:MULTISPECIES: hypothetical protein [unclassified Streptomyces]RKT18073.1 hypothetical protein BX285_2486 [Streptomyces sp. 1114.5]SOB84291.1 hypothetical protein SAMN06272789_4536 [Streptomyces sp. 1331.2]
MTFLLGFLLALVAAIVGITAFLLRRERARRLHSDDLSGVLIEQQRTAEAASMRTAYTSRHVHGGHGLMTDEVHRYGS